MFQLSNPCRGCTVENFPMGGGRTSTATFTVESVNGKGERVSRVTVGNKPKKTTYHAKICVVFGEDGKHYCLGLTTTGQIVLWMPNMKHTKYFYAKDEEYGVYRSLLESI